LKTSRLLPYLIALVLLAWVLGTLAHSGTGGGSLLANSYWLVYAIELMPLLALGLIVVFIGLLIANWKFIAEALGSGMSRNRRVRGKKSWRIMAIVWLTTWSIAIVYLEIRCHGLICSTSGTNATAASIQNVVAGSGPLPSIPLLGAVVTFASLVDTNLFAATFFGVLIVSSVIMVRAVMVHLEDTRNESVQFIEAVQEQGRDAVRAALKILDDDSEGDARQRILTCYQKMIEVAAHLGAPVGLDKTARELELAIRSTFQLNGSGIARLTRLFEEARYSLHAITWEDADMARECLTEINEELGRTVTAEA
jgi:hypothetical protein